ncbi:hypothetical protein ABID81_002335 [Frigoribacterium sp. PvP054]
MLPFSWGELWRRVLRGWVRSRPAPGVVRGVLRVVLVLRVVRWCGSCHAFVAAMPETRSNATSFPPTVTFGTASANDTLEAVPVTSTPSAPV